MCLCVYACVCPPVGISVFHIPLTRCGWGSPSQQSSVCVCQCQHVTSVPAQQTVYMIIKRPLCLQTSLLCVCACVWLCVCYFGQKHHFKRLLPWRYLKVKRLGFSFCSVFSLFCVCVCADAHFNFSVCLFSSQGFWEAGISVSR